MHFFWWVSILIFALVLLAAAHRYRKGNSLIKNKIKQSWNTTLIK
jgi:hypothetical protein